MLNYLRVLYSDTSNWIKYAYFYHSWPINYLFNFCGITTCILPKTNMYSFDLSSSSPWVYSLKFFYTTYTLLKSVLGMGGVVIFDPVSVSLLWPNRSCIFQKSACELSNYLKYKSCINVTDALVFWIAWMTNQRAWIIFLVCHGQQTISKLTH